MNDTAKFSLEDVGKRVEERFLESVDATPDPRFDELVNLTTLEGQSTGYCRVYSADRLVKGSMFSMAVPPIGRYFNIHIIPEACYRIPRFVYEGMITSRGSQMTIDLFPDGDIVMDFDNFEEQYQGIGEIYERARADERFDWQPSRLHFMRAFFSPYVLLSFTIQEAELSAMEDYALAYFEEWLKIYSQGIENNKENTEHIAARRERMQTTMKHRDPDLPAVIAVYGEEKTRAIQDATLL